MSESVAPALNQPPEREIRFAVVIYGGVSLAIYINGIIQEMLRMARSTALPVEKLSPLELVYRELACCVGVGIPAAEDLEARGELDESLDVQDSPAPQPRTRFVVDILSGTSAGGINAIYCAKALACGQSLDQLARLWVDVADISKLLNDRGSVEPPLQFETPPKALLNGKWMYLKLLNALDGMDAKGARQDGPIVDDLDVFLTATDLDGLPLPLALPHQNVDERRHRNVFHFVRRPDDALRRDPSGPRERDDFTPDNNPFFAFAARCTSAFPFAFEPMALCDIFPIIQNLDPHKDQEYCKEDTGHWRHFYLDYIRAQSPRLTPFIIRAFGDGGYLDNKPFSYAIQTIAGRNADIPVDRKLIYIEPSPDEQSAMFKRRKDSSDRADAIENSLAALITLPRYETIREDLMRVLEWNRNVARLKRVIAELRHRIEGEDPGSYRQTLAFQSYRLLRLSATTDTMASRVSEALDLDPVSGRAEALRDLVDDWRTPVIEDEFLETYDFGYLIRAIQYLNTKIRRSQVRSLSSGTRQSPEYDDLQSDATRLAYAKKFVRKCMEESIPSLAKPGDGQPGIQLSAELRDKDLDYIASAGATSTRNPGDYRAARRERVREVLDQRHWRSYIDAAHQRLKAHYGKILDAPPSRDEARSESPRQMLSGLLAKYGGQDRFDVQDSIVFPITFQTNVGEFGEIDVVRISPQDVSPIEGVTDSDEFRKLRGDSFGAFGGFLDRGWRKHDILRGRLDGAERLITAVLPGSQRKVADLRMRLIREAQEQIALEWERDYEPI